ncbi:tetratricopeptide repeat protein [Lysobacter sp. S4-A87]|uniref:tetratricopeptide repeat protein n=1 Tax=Lysobacter sp. S4-A87 TaxID=2925843 RepID=UPI001F53236C|nr:tetratricopeptide repeat protein [Lysobacter sp. S4-A87]UNK49391.1 tetratricopeptide repeat protein [Lysobacter sp. S4-A87]
MNPNGMAGQGGLTTESYRFDDIVVDATAHTLSRAGTPQTVEPKAFAVLLMLLRRAGELVGRDELLDQVWGHRHVTPGVLTRVIAQLRHALGDDSQRPRYIQTQHALGYRFIGQLKVGADAVPGSPEHADRAEPASDPLEGVAAVRQSVPASLNVAANEAEAPAADGVGDAAGYMPASAGTADEAAFAPSPLGDAQVAAPAGALSVPNMFRTRRRALARRKWWMVAAALLVIAAGGYWFGQRERAAAPVAEASIAVLPFVSLSADSQDSYFAEGLGVEMHDALAGVPGLRVVAAPGRGKQQVDIKALGAQLGVATLLDASVRREGPRVRISARLSDTRTGFTLWAHSYDRETGDVFALQSDIANEVVQALVGVLPGSGLDSARQALARRLTPTRNVAAYDAYLKGQQQIRVRGDKANPDSAITYFRGALAIDPGFARAQAGICRAEIDRFEGARDAAAFERAQSACKRASDMDPSLREVSLAMGDLHRARGESDAAVEQYTHALADPVLRADAYLGMARVASAQGRGDLATDYFERARKLHPRDPAVFQQLGYHQYTSGDVPAAIESYRTAVTLQPDDEDLWSSLGGLYQANGNVRQAIASYERSLEIRPNYGALSNLGSVKYDNGSFEEAAALFRHAAELDGSDFRLWGNLGDALSASATTAAQAREPYQRAAQMADRYLKLKSDDAQGFALLAWYLANLGEGDKARSMLARAESIATERGEVAFYGAQAMAVLDDLPAARKQLQAARQEGIPEVRIAATPVLRRLAAQDMTASRAP